MRFLLLSCVISFASLAAQAAVSGQEITGFELATGKESFQLKASATHAYISSIDEILAASDVAIVVKQDGKEIHAHCASFSHHLKHELATCDDRATHTSMTIDMRNEKVTYYSAL